MEVKQLELYRQRLAENYESTCPMYADGYGHADIQAAFLAGFTAGQAVGELIGELKYCQKYLAFAMESGSVSHMYWETECKRIRSDLAKLLAVE